MLSTQYRLRLESICDQIAKGKDVKLEDMIWAQKLAKSNTTAATWMRQARQRAANPVAVIDLATKMGMGHLPIKEDTPGERDITCADITELQKLGWSPTINILDTVK